MASKITYTRQCSAAFTLVELMIATALGLLGTAAVLSYIVFSARSTAALENYFDLNLHTQLAVDQMSQQIRQVQRLIACSTTNLTFQDCDGGVLQYNYDPVSHILSVESPVLGCWGTWLKMPRCYSFF